MTLPRYEHPRLFVSPEDYERIMGAERIDNFDGMGWPEELVERLMTKLREIAPFASIFPRLATVEVIVEYPEDAWEQPSPGVTGPVAVGPWIEGDADILSGKVPAPKAFPDPVNPARAMVQDDFTARMEELRDQVLAKINAERAEEGKRPIELGKPQGLTQFHLEPWQERFFEEGPPMELGTFPERTTHQLDLGDRGPGEPYGFRKWSPSGPAGEGAYPETGPWKRPSLWARLRKALSRRP